MKLSFFVLSYVRQRSALQLRGVADSKSSAQRVGALCIAGLTLRMASHVLPCSRKLMRSATLLPEDSKGTRTFLWPWVQHLGIAGGFSSFLAAKRTIPGGDTKQRLAEFTA
jgi:hypothetical protein